MKKYILIFLLLLSSKIGLSQIRYDLNNEQQIAISYTNPKVYEVAEIEVIGEKYLDEVALKSLAGIKVGDNISIPGEAISCLLYTSPSPRDLSTSRMPSSA